MSDRVLLTFILLSAIILALVYRPILAKLSVGLVSPYAKADMTKRLFAATVDGMLVAIGWSLIAVRNRWLMCSLEPRTCSCETQCGGAASESSFAVSWSSTWRRVAHAVAVRPSAETFFFCCLERTSWPHSWRRRPVYEILKAND
jgi:hypothetical protein